MPAFALAVSIGVRPARADVALISAARDNTLIEDPAGALSNGSGPAFFVGRIGAESKAVRRGVMAFDVAGTIPPGSTIDAAVLTLYMSRTNAGPVPVALHDIVADWGEAGSSSSGGGGAPAAPGDATWLHRFYDTAFWASPGGDFDPTPRVVTVVDQADYYLWGPSSEMTADVQRWLDRPASNYGWLLRGDESSPMTVKRFESREAPDEPTRPVLAVAFVPPCGRDRSVGSGYWHRQCLGLDPPGRGLAPLAPTEPGFVESLVPCANATLLHLGLGFTVCDLLGAHQDRDPCVGMSQKLAVLVLNLCSQRLQTSCPAGRWPDRCRSRSVGELLKELASRITAGDCRQAAICAASAL